MRKFIEMEVCGEVYSLPVDMRVIEIVERVYNQNVDMVAAMVLTNAAQVRLTDLASVVMGWLASKEGCKLTQREIKEYTYTLDSNGLRVLIGSVQAACLYFRNHITEEQFDLLVRGEDLPAEPIADEDVDRETGKLEKKARRASSGRKSATK